MIWGMHPLLWIAARALFLGVASFMAGGISRAEVFIVLERCYPKDGPRKRPKVMDDQPGSLGFFINPERSHEPNCEGIF